MFIPEYDATTGLPTYWSWALPGTVDSDAAWRIVKWTWTSNAGAALWADGDANLDNVRANRTSLTYAADATLSLEDASFADVVPTGIPGSSFTVPFVIPAAAVPWLDSTPMKRVSAPPVGNQYRLTGPSAFEVGDVIGSGAWFYLRVPLA